MQAAREALDAHVRHTVGWHFDPGPEPRMLEAIGPTLVCSAITCKPELRKALLDAVHIDRLNLGPVPTTQLNWLQLHEGNIVDFLFRSRAFQTAGL